MSQYTTRQVAEMLGVTPRRVRQLAISRNVGTKIGGQRGLWLFSPEDVDAMRSRPVGRPPESA